MEIDHIVEKEEASDEEKEEEEVLDPIEINPFDSTDNESLIVGIYGNGFAFLKSSLLSLIKANRAYKVKFMTKNKVHKQLPKKLICELYQINDDGKNYLVLLTKSYFGNYFYNEVLEYINQKHSLKYNNIVVADSIFSKQIITKSESEKSSSINRLYHLKNSFYNYTVNFNHLPFPNKIRGFASYLFTYAETFRIGCLVIVSCQEEYQINIDSISIFNSFADSHMLLKNKISESYLTSNQINLRSNVFAELDSSNKIIYT